MTKILLVEDDKSLREIYGVRLLAEGYDIVSAGDGEEALAMAIKERPQLIISDVMMPKISGFDMLDILRSTTETRDIKVIMMTALSSEDQRSRGEQLGADRYLVKSQVGIEDVVRTVHEVMGDGGAKTNATPTPASAPVSESPAPAADATPVAAPGSTPESAAANAAPSPATDTAASVPPTTPDVVATTSIPVSSPGNESAGPLPLQPSETESALPQPTAPFSSPAPSSLGEQITQLETSVDNLDNSEDLPAPSVDLVGAIENEPAADQSAPSAQPASGPAPLDQPNTGYDATASTPEATDQQSPGGTPPVSGTPVV